MKKLQSVLQITKNLLLYEWSDKRVIMGFLAGAAVPFYWLKNFLDYAVSTGEPVNILEAFVVVEHEYKSVMFLVLGWFLIVSDAPFINGNTYYSLCRTKKRSWNFTMIFYILVQAMLYTAGVALPMVMASLPRGFWGKMWSSPVYLLSQDYTASRSAKYGISFLQRDMMRGMNALQAFFATMLCFFLYLVLMGFILYTGNLLLGGIRGTAIAFLVHTGGCGLRFLGHTGSALIRYASPGNFADAGGIHLARPVAAMLLLAAALVALQCCLIGKADLKEQVHVPE